MALCHSPRLELTELFALICGISIAVILYILCTLIVYVRREPASPDEIRTRPSRATTNATFVFFTMAVISMSTQIASVFQFCKHSNSASLLHLTRCLYLFQCNAITAIWYLQLHRVSLFFNTTKPAIPLQLSAVATVICCILLITSVLSAIVVFLLESTATVTEHMYTWSLLVYTSAAAYGALCVFVACIICRRSCHVYISHTQQPPPRPPLAQSRYSSSNVLANMINPKLHVIIAHKLTRITALYLLSTPLSMCTLLVVISLNSESRSFDEFLSHFLILLDTVKNALLLLLSYSFYRKFYTRFCRHLHQLCTAMTAVCGEKCVHLKSSSSPSPMSLSVTPSLSVSKKRASEREEEKAPPLQRVRSGGKRTTALQRKLTLNRDGNVEPTKKERVPTMSPSTGAQLESSSNVMSHANASGLAPYAQANANNGKSKRVAATRQDKVASVEIDSEEDVEAKSNSKSDDEPAPTVRPKLQPRSTQTAQMEEILDGILASYDVRQSVNALTLGNVSNLTPIAGHAPTTPVMEVFTDNEDMGTDVDEEEAP